MSELVYAYIVYDIYGAESRECVGAGVGGGRNHLFNEHGVSLSFLVWTQRSPNRRKLVSEFNDYSAVARISKMIHSTEARCCQVLDIKEHDSEQSLSRVPKKMNWSFVVFWFAICYQHQPTLFEANCIWLFVALHTLTLNAGLVLFLPHFLAQFSVLSDGLRRHQVDSSNRPGLSFIILPPSQLTNICGPLPPPSQCSKFQSHYQGI